MMPALPPNIAPVRVAIRRLHDPQWSVSVVYTKILSRTASRAATDETIGPDVGELIGLVVSDHIEKDRGLTREMLVEAICELTVPDVAEIVYGLRDPAIRDMVLAVLERIGLSRSAVVKPTSTAPRSRTAPAAKSPGPSSRDWQPARPDYDNDPDGSEDVS